MNKILKNKASTIIATILMLTILTATTVLPSAFAWNSATTAAVNAGMKWDFPNAANFDASSTRLLIWNRYHDRVPTRVYNVIAPNPVGVGQLFTVVFYQPIVPPDALLTNDIRYQYYNVITKPDGTTERLPPSGTITSDSTGTNYFGYTPDQTGNYTVTTVFVEQTYRWYGSSTQRDFYGITLLSSNYTTTVTVQQEPVAPIGFVTTPLPSEYWTRPIEGQNTQWYQVASNWLGNDHDESNGGPNNRFQRDGTAPNSGHILWTKPVEDGGLLGGANFSTPGEVFNAGHQYQPRFQKQIIMWGRLYYEVPVTFSGGGGGWMSVDLRTGEDLWDGPRNFGSTSTTFTFGGQTFTFTTNIGPSFGYYYDFDSPNQHGVTTPGWLFTNNFAQSIHPRYGTLGQVNVTNAPSGFESVGPKGEVLRYVLDNAGTNLNPSWRLIQWNSSKVLTDEVMSVSEGSINGSLTRTSPNRLPFDWNVSAPWRNGMTGGSITVRSVIQNDILLGSNGSVPQGTGSPSFGYPEESTWWAISLKPESRGQLLWMKNIKMVNEQFNDMLSYQRAAEGVFVFVEMPTLKFVGFSMYTGERLWETEPLSELNPFGYFSYPSLMYDESTTIAYGKLFVGGYLGHVVAFDLQSGSKLWTYAAPTDMSVFKYYTLMLGAVADGKLYVGAHEHSADTPLFKGNRLRALDVNTGKEVFTMLGWPHPRTMAIADGILIYWNNYDHQVYAVGKGPSQTTVDAPMTSITQGSSIVIRGTVTDVSAGTEQKEQAARFPIGIPAVNDASMSQWMEYVYMQKERPTNTTGVEVVLSVLDPNGNNYDIGTATSDSTGTYSYMWEPPVPGKYTVIARFAGTESYWPSYAATALGVSEAQATPIPPPQTLLPPTEMYFAASTAAIIIAIAIATILLLRKRQ